MSDVLPSHVWKLIGAQPGPMTIVIGGTHGDELVGIEVIKKLLNMFQLTDEPSGSYVKNDLTGTLFLIFGNPQAIQLRTRGASDIRDLNRCFIQSDLDRAPASDDISDLTRARELAPILASAKYVIDLHGTSSDSPPFVCLGSDSPEHRRLHRLLPVKYILSDPQNILARDQDLSSRGTTDDFVDRYGGIALAYETGKEDDLKRVDQVKDDVLRLLNEIGHLVMNIPLKQTFEQQVFALYSSIHAQSEHFTYSPGMESGWQAVKKDQLVGTYADGVEERISEDGILVFPKSPKKIQVGKNLYYLAKKVES